MLVMLSVSLATSMLLVESPATAAAEEGEVEQLWLGRQVVTGTRVLPVIGEVPTGTETVVLAEIRWLDERIAIHQRPCSVRFKRVLGIDVRMGRGTVQRLPRTVISLRAHGTVQQGQTWIAEPWTVAWQNDDVDVDGHPGATAHVDATLCSGDIYVASRATTQGFFTMQGEELVGEVRVRVRQRVLGSTSYCLSLVSQDTDNVEVGQVRYRKAAVGTTCDSLQALADSGGQQAGPLP